MGISMDFSVRELRSLSNPMRILLRRLQEAQAGIDPADLTPRETRSVHALVRRGLVELRPASPCRGAYWAVSERGREALRRERERQNLGHRIVSAMREGMIERGEIEG